jgi:syntaxin-binding protein 1
MWGPQGPVDKDLKRRIKQKQSSEEEYELSRYKPLLRTVIEVPPRPSSLL